MHKNFTHVYNKKIKKREFDEIKAVPISSNLHNLYLKSFTGAN